MNLPSVADPIKDPQAPLTFLKLFAAEPFSLSSDIIVLLNILLDLSVNEFQSAIPLRPLKFHALAADQICHKRMICSCFYNPMPHFSTH